MNSSNRPPTILGVAKTAGLSVGTVSRAMNNQPSVSKDAMNAVLRAMALHRTFAASSPLSVKAVAAVVPPSATALHIARIVNRGFL
jgi:DNA-binding LacI/PurR family transcriptional regulator